MVGNHFLCTLQMGLFIIQLHCDFTSFFNSISFISGQKEDDNERTCAVNSVYSRNDLNLQRESKTLDQKASF